MIELFDVTLCIILLSQSCKSLSSLYIGFNSTTLHSVAYKHYILTELPQQRQGIWYWCNTASNLFCETLPVTIAKAIPITYPSIDSSVIYELDVTFYSSNNRNTGNKQMPLIACDRTNLCNLLFHKTVSSNGSISASLVLCVGNPPITGEFPSQRPVTRCFDVFVDLRLNKRLGKQS